MPRHSLSPRKARAALLALRLESARREAMASRKDHHAYAAALALRQNTPDWVEMDAQIKQLQLEAEMDAMEAVLEARKPKTPVLNFDLIPGFEPPVDLLPAGLETLGVARAVTGAVTRAITGAVHPPPPTSTEETSAEDKDWKYPGYGDNPRPEDDWRNYE